MLGYTETIIIVVENKSIVLGPHCMWILLYYRGLQVGWHKFVTKNLCMHTLGGDF